MVMEEEENQEEKAIDNFEEIDYEKQMMERMVEKWESEEFDDGSNGEEEEDDDSLDDDFQPEQEKESSEEEGDEGDDHLVPPTPRLSRPKDVSSIFEKYSHAFAWC